MYDMNVRIACGIKGANPSYIDRDVSVAQEQLEQFIPPTPSGNAGIWPHVSEAERLVCSMVKEEFFPDEITPLEDIEDLKKIGVTVLAFAFEHEDRGIISTTSIYPD